MKRGTSQLKRTPFKQSGGLSRSPLKRTSGLKSKGRASQTRTLKSGRVILGRKEYKELDVQCWERDRGECQIRHNEPNSLCWGLLPEVSTRWLDHIKKRSQGGSDTLENVRLACPPCHDWADNQGGKLQERRMDLEL